MNLLFGLFLLSIGTIGIIYRSEIIDGFFSSQNSYGLWASVTAVLFGYRRAIHAINILNEPRFNMKTEEWMVKNDMPKEKFD